MPGIGMCPKPSFRYVIRQIGVRVQTGSRITVKVQDNAGFQPVTAFELGFQLLGVAFQADAQQDKCIVQTIDAVTVYFLFEDGLIGPIQPFGIAGRMGVGPQTVFQRRIPDNAFKLFQRDMPWHNDCLTGRNGYGFEGVESRHRCFQIRVIERQGQRRFQPRH